jgi:hypothetical protein
VGCSISLNCPNPPPLDEVAAEPRDAIIRELRK